MRQAQVYRWQLPMDAGVVLRERRLKTRDGLLLRLSLIHISEPTRPY